MGRPAGVADVTSREQAAYRAGIEAVLEMALIAAVTIEVRPDAQEVRQRAAAAALQGLAEGARAVLLAKDRPDGERI